MENKQEKLTYEQLSQKFGELYSQYQKATDYINKLRAALDEQVFNQTSFFLSMLFKVVEHPEMYPEDFVKWTLDNIQAAMKSFAESLIQEPEKKEEEKPAK